MWIAGSISTLYPMWIGRMVGEIPTRAIPLVTLVGQVVKTPPFHGGNMGSIPIRVIDLQLVVDTYMSGR